MYYEHFVIGERNKGKKTIVVKASTRDYAEGDLQPGDIVSIGDSSQRWVCREKDGILMFSPVGRL